MKAKKKTVLGQNLISGLSQAVAFERGQVKLKTVERELAPPAPEFSKAQIKKLRTEILDCTQLEFASLLNVDIGTIRHWEQGLRKPAGSVYRLLEIILKKPEIVEELIGA
ncbi:MAG: helix-turn-helix domain-containing protein [Pseudobdellovibrionaceae bacterium]